MTTETLAERLAKCVKPLKWTPRSDGRQWYGNSPRGLYLSYTAVMGQETGEWSCYLRDFWRPFPTLEAAKAAAQADYQSRILAALDMDAIARLIAEAVEKEREAAYRDGFAAAVEVVRTMRTHYSWGPKATADYGVQCERQAILGALEANAAAIRARAAQTEKEG